MNNMKNEFVKECRLYSAMYGAVAFLLIMMIACARAQTLSIAVNASQKFQRIDNFSASDAWWAQKIGSEWTTANKDSIADLLFSTTKGIGLSAWRFNIGAGTDQTITDPWRTVEGFERVPGVFNWSRDAGGQWFLQAAVKRGVKQLIGFVNSPPAWMTRNGHTYGTDGLGSTNLKSGYYDDYANYLATIVKHFQDSLGISFTYIDPVNEPQWDWSSPSQEGNRASDVDIRNIVDSLHAVLTSQNLSTQILVPESGDLPDWYQVEGGISQEYHQTYGDFLDSLFGYPDIVSNAAHIFAGHSYGSDLLSTQLVQDRQTLGAKLAPYLYNGYRYWVTEYCILTGPYGQGGNGRDLTMTTALDVARIIHFDLTAANASAWQWWTAVSHYDYKDGLIYTDFVNPGDKQNIIQSKLLWTLGNFSRYIRPGSQRISCTGADNPTGLMASAYVDSSGSRIIMVLINAGTTDQKIDVSLSGLSSSQKLSYFTPFVTSNEKGCDLRKFAYFPADSAYDVPAYSAVTLVGMLDGSAYTAGTPGSASLLTPANGDTLIGEDTSATWDPVAGATSYEVQISTDSLFSTAAVDSSGINTPSLSLMQFLRRPYWLSGLENTLFSNTKYYWRVIASNDSGSGSFSLTSWFITPWSATGISSLPVNVPAAFSLSQNYPNPFNPTTAIKVGLDKSGVISLKITNALGQTMDEIAQGYKPAGEYTFDINMDMFPSGAYFYTLQDGSESITKKMLLLK